MLAPDNIARLNEGADTSSPCPWRLVVKVKFSQTQQPQSASAPEGNFP
jgi:hypothetical protein